MFPTPVMEVPSPRINWDSFIPDLIVGVFTGLVVGLILAWSQARAAEKRERREVELRWEALRPRVAARLLEPWDRRHIGPSLMHFASRTDALRDLIADVPLASWAEVLNNSELRSLHEFYKAATDLHGAAPKFDYFLRDAIVRRLINPATATTGEWRQADKDAEPLVPEALRALFAPSERAWRADPTQPHNAVIAEIIENPPPAYADVLSMVERAESHYIECLSIVDAVMTRYYYD